ncbi:MAG: response regulator [Bacteroidia bacterium]
MSTKIKIAIVDDMALWRTSFAGLISTMKDMQVVCSVSDGKALIEYANNNPLDIVFLDVDMRIGMDGLETLKAVKDEHLDLKIIMLSTHHEKKLVETCLELGAKAYLSKDSDEEFLFEMIRYVYDGKNCVGISKALCNELCENIAKDLREKYDLSEKELEVLYLSCKGKPIKLIASELGHSERTVQRHIESIYKKTQSKSKSEIISFGIKNGIAW